MGRSRGGLTTKIHALVDANGLPIDLRLSEGQHADCRYAEDLLSRLHAGTTLLADRGYDTDAIRATATQAKAFANIPAKRNRKKDLRFQSVPLSLSKPRRAVLQPHQRSAWNCNALRQASRQLSCSNQTLLCAIMDKALRVYGLANVVMPQGVKRCIPPRRRSWPGAVTGLI